MPDVSAELQKAPELQLQLTFLWLTKMHFVGRVFIFLITTLSRPTNYLRRMSSGK
jgi:hypothetical protein